jgi:hypothetical protein
MSQFLWDLALFAGLRLAVLPRAVAHGPGAVVTLTEYLGAFVALMLLTPLAVASALLRKRDDR